MPSTNPPPLSSNRVLCVDSHACIPGVSLHLSAQQVGASAGVGHRKKKTNSTQIKFIIIVGTRKKNVISSLSRSHTHTHSPSPVGDASLLRNFSVFHVDLLQRLDVLRYERHRHHHQVLAPVVRKLVDLGICVRLQPLHGPHPRLVA